MITTKVTTEQQDLTGTTQESALVFALYSEGKVDESRLLCDELLPLTSGDARTALLITRSIIERGQGNYALSLGILEACEAESPVVKGALHNGIAIACRRLGQLDRALIEYHGAASYFAEIGHSTYLARVSNNIANILLDLGRLDEAQEYLREAEKGLSDDESLAEFYDTKSRAYRIKAQG